MVAVTRIDAPSAVRLTVLALISSALESAVVRVTGSNSSMVPAITKEDEDSPCCISTW
jgi:hypothetical protein